MKDPDIKPTFARARFGKSLKAKIYLSLRFPDTHVQTKAVLGVERTARVK